MGVGFENVCATWTDNAAPRVLVRALDVPFIIPATPFRVTASIGVALFPEHAAEAGPLVTSADCAMLLAKRCGGNRYRRARGPSLHGGISLALKSYACFEAGAAANSPYDASPVLKREET